MTSSRDDAQPTPLPDDPAGILTAARTRRAEADQAEADLLQLAPSPRTVHHDPRELAVREDTVVAEQRRFERARWWVPAWCRGSTS